MFLEDDKVVFNNNLAERSIKLSVKLRKSSLFSKSPAGCETNAMYLSFIEIAKANQLDSKSYLNYLFTELPERSQNLDSVDLEIYLPWHVKPEALKQDPKGNNHSYSQRFHLGQSFVQHMLSHPVQDKCILLVKQANSLKNYFLATFL